MAERARFALPSATVMVVRERRAHPRYRLWVPARLEGDEQPSRLAVGHDMSQKGSLLVTMVELSPGDRVRLFVRIPPTGEGEEQEIAARVLRVEVNDADPHGLWPYRVAVEFDEPSPELEELLRSHSEVLEGVADSSEQTE
jgi:hypothetical protein